LVATNEPDVPNEKNAFSLVLSTIYVKVGGVTVTESNENPCMFVLDVPPFNPPKETAPVLTEPLTALNKFPNDKLVLGIILLLYVINI
jgi:hypothetical protein